MLLSEWLKDSSLFEEINSIQPFPFIVEYGSRNLDLVLRMGYGSRKVPTNIEPLTINEVANIIIVNYGDNWGRKFTLLKEEVLLGVESKTIVTERILDDTNKQLTSTQTNKVSAFNDESDIMVNNDSSVDSLKDDTNKEVNKDTETIVTNLNAIKNQLTMFNTNFINEVCNDVSKIVSLSIY